MPIKFYEMSLFHKRTSELAQRYASSLNVGSSPELTQRYHQDLLEATDIYRRWSDLRDQLGEQEVRFRAEIEEELHYRKARLEKRQQDRQGKAQQTG